jgi:hypothetical protein
MELHTTSRALVDDRRRAKARATDMIGAAVMTIVAPLAAI